MKKPEQVIEFPSSGQTYNNPEFGVYEYSIYPRHSVLAGSERRVFLDSFETLEEARKAFPAATVTYSAEHEAAQRQRDLDLAAERGEISGGA